MLPDRILALFRGILRWKCTFVFSDCKLSQVQDNLYLGVNFASYRIDHVYVHDAYALAIGEKKKRPQAVSFDRSQATANPKSSEQIESK